MEEYKSSSDSKRIEHTENSDQKDLEVGLVFEIPENLEDTSPPEHRVPSTIRELNEAAYTPQLISIGPIHWGNPKLKTMEIQKPRYLRYFCERCAPKEEQKFLSEVFSTIKVYEIEVRQGYAESSLGLSSIEFVKMVILDGIFILELFLRHLNELMHKDDFIIGKPWLRSAIQLDFMLLENQLPFFILEKIYAIAFPDQDKRGLPSLVELSCEYFSDHKPFRELKISDLSPLHFTDLVRCFWSLEHPAPHKSINGLCSITKLNEAGVKFKALQQSCLLDLRFEMGTLNHSPLCRFLPLGHLGGAVLQIPRFQVDDTTERVVRNVMALEQTHYPYHAYICNYIMLLNFLINTREDVDLLVERKILINGLGSSAAVVKLVNKLCQRITVVNSCYYPLSVQLNEYYESYRSSPTSILKTFVAALIVAAILVILWRP